MTAFYSKIDQEEILERICEYVGVDMPNLYSSDFADNIRQICVYKLCNVIGIKCSCNYRNEFMTFFSDIAGEALVIIFGLKFHIASEELRFISYDHVNLVNLGCKLLKQEDKDEAFLDIFKLADEFKYIKCL